MVIKNRTPEIEFRFTFQALPHNPTDYRLNIQN